MLNHYYKTDSSQELINYTKGLSKDDIIEVLVQFYESYYLESGGDDFEESKKSKSEYDGFSMTIKRTAINRLRNMLGGKSLMNRDRNSKIDKILGDEKET